MELKAGYKQTEVGVIPEDWEVKTIDQIGFVASGKRLPLGQSLTSHPTPHPYIRVTDMRPGTVSCADLKFVPESVFHAIKRYRIFRGDIFISVAGTLGIVGKIPPELDGANLTENADRITNLTCSQDFLLYLLMSPLIQNTIDAIQTVGAQPKLALNKIRQFAIPLPSTETEQRAIAEAISDADALIESLNQLITKKRNLKQAAMQQLLTGQTRLPGFSGEWEVKRIGDEVDLLTGFPFPSTGYKSSGIRLLRGSNVKRGTTDWADDISQYWPSTSAELSNYELRAGDLVISMDGSLVGRSYARIKNDDLPALLLQRVARIRSIKKLDVSFLAAFIGSDWFVKYTDSVKTVTAIPHISPGDIRSFSILCPPTTDEQTAIATMLSDMDTELAELESRLAKARHIKQGMMQELLTGKIRLV